MKIILRYQTWAKKRSIQKKEDKIQNWAEEPVPVAGRSRSSGHRDGFFVALRSTQHTTAGNGIDLHIFQRKTFQFYLIAS